MMSRTRFEGNYSTTPRYNTQAVVRETAVPADTFRAWERRYDVPKPHRSSSGQRLYSERDVALIRWLRDRTVEGMTISQAVRLLNIKAEEPDDRQAAQWAVLVRRLVDALLALRTSEADDVLGEAFAYYSLEQVCTLLIQPALVEIGEGWRQGRVSAGQEHFATNIVRRRLQALYSVYDVVAGAATVVTACVPTEQHDVGVLILSLMLVRRGYRVVYLGANVPATGLLGIVEQVNPDLVCLSVTTPEAFGQFDAVIEAPRPPLIAVGGQGVQPSPMLRYCHWLQGEASTVMTQIDALLARRARGAEASASSPA
jgi:MerR family transcriptional regulator, light-induced transcriptional regulator